MKEEFLDEIRLMLEIGEHPNILKLVGCQTVQEPYYLITEYMEYGSLKDYFKKCRKVINFSLQSVQPEMLLSISSELLPDT